MTKYLNFLVISAIGMLPYIASAQSDCGGGVILSIKNNWNNMPNMISITTDNTISRAKNRYLKDNSVMIDLNYAAGTKPYADIIEIITAAYAAGSYLHFYQTRNYNICESIDQVQVCRSSDC